MAFPASALRIAAEVALGADLTASPLTWAWTDVTALVKSPGVTINRGRANEFSSAAPSTATATMNNTDGRWVERYPVGVWYGLIGFNTPVRYLVTPEVNSASDAFGRTVSNGFGTADVGGAWTVDGTASEYSVTGSAARLTLATAATRRYAVLSPAYAGFDVTVRVRTAALSTGAAQSAGILFHYTGASDSNRGEIIFNTDQSIGVRHVVRSGGTETFGTTAVTGLTHVANTWYRVRVQSVNAAGTRVRAKAWLDGSAEPAAWNKVNTIPASNAAAAKIGLTGTRESGNTNASAVIEFDDFAFVDGPVLRHTGYAGNLPRRWPDHSLTVMDAPITAYGLSGRLQQGDPIRSAIRAGIMGGTKQPRAYWPCEDGSRATTVASGLVGGQAMAIAGLEGLGAAQAAGSDPVISVTGTGLMRGPVTAYTPGDWNVQWLANLPSAPATTQALLRWYTGGTYQLWQLVLVPGGGAGDVVKLQAYDAGWVERLADTGVAFPASLYGQQLWIEVTAFPSGSDTVYSYTVWAAGATAASGGTTKLSSTPGAVTQVAFGNGADGAGLAGMALGHIVVYDDATIVNGMFASRGWGNEPSYLRVARLGQQESVLLTMATPTNDWATMGAPSSGSLLAQLREIEQAEVGILFDDLDGGITVLGREGRANRPVALTLDVTAHQLAGLEPDNDDQQLCNEATSSQPGGTSSRYQNTTSKRSISRAGTYPKTFSSNVFNPADLVYDAQFRTALGTVDDDRYTTVTFSLTGNPSLIPAWLACDIGSRIQITNTSALFAPDPIDLVIDGYQETISSADWRVTLHTSSAKPWMWWIAETGTGNQSRADSDASTLAAGVSSSATSLSVATTAGHPLWVTGAVNFDINVAGERMTVTNISGSSSPQTFTVTRHVNGVVKAQSTVDALGNPTKVSLWQPSVVAL